MTTATPSETIIKSTKAALGVAGISQAAMGRALNLSRAQIALRFNGSTRLQIDEVITIAWVFGVNINDLISGPSDWLDRVDPGEVRSRLESATRSNTHMQPYGAHAPAITGVS